MSSADDPVASRYAALADLAGDIADRLQDVVDKLGFDAAPITLHAPDDAVFRLQRDPSDGRDSLVGEWRDECGIKFGELLFHADGSFFVEHDIGRPHPAKPRWFVEAVNAWGREGQIKAEARLLRMPE
ncbi:MAG: hypothetical protein QNJ91_02260 [Gammaproteobacteria bacterium]|nr:hypothetical protein [Gammaproteobacteria bacterium]